MTVGTIVLIVLIIILVGALSTWAQSKNRGYYLGGADPRAKGRTDQIVGRVKRATQIGLWQDVEFVPKIVEKLGR